MSLDLKREFLRLLREDEEFRYAVMGLLGVADLRTSLDNLIKAGAKHGEVIDKLRSSVKELRKTIEALARPIKELRKDALSEDVRDTAKLYS
ncbi:hypothetical protein Pisl_0067 [Pyrobaculum islandicum DSM 4184]|uniref:Uncharacterized protein n=1 Tax=Pyrobaculum islandicum (strain DSM 4184 / JCM 9189 / GEO3) TaxID=384616 RepID=A1RQL9_PYRIL|nr:hypothetical protein [Pyrobaculum islandicum]ABL87251.1 hypothetical protein Pisl_0067 [Pyrobaculum islandicum DSM 4184]